MKNSLVIKIIIVFIALCVIPLISMNVLFIKFFTDYTERNVEEGLYKLALEKAEVLSLSLKQIENRVEFIGMLAAKTMDKPVKAVLPAYYERDDRGILGRNYSPSSKWQDGELSSISNIYLPANVALNDKLLADIIVSEEFDSAFDKALKMDASLTWMYIVTGDGLMRTYPYLHNDVFSPLHDQRLDIFYQIASPERNPGRRVVWSEPYFDYAGKGWMITCSYPVYIDNVFKAVVCADVSLKTLNRLMADFKLSKTGFAFLMDSAGNIVYHPDYIPPDSEQGAFLRRNLFTDNDNKDYLRIIGNMAKGNKGVEEYLNPVSGKTQWIAYTPVSNFGWSIGIEVSKEDYIMGINRTSGGFLLFGGVIALIISVFGIYLFWKLSFPIRQLTSEVKNIASGEVSQVQIRSQDEIGVLAQSFNNLINTIEENTNNILYQKSQLESVFNAFGERLMILDTEYRIRMSNKERKNRASGDSTTASKKYNYCYERLMGLPKPCPGCPVASTMESGAGVTAEIIHGADIYQVTSFPIRQENGHSREFVVYSRKITEQVMLERQLSQKEKMAIIGQLAAGVAHELKNPLAVIKGTSYLFKKCVETKDWETVLEILGEIDLNVSRSEKVIYTLLDFSGTGRQASEQIEVRGLIEQILILVKRMIVQNGIKVQLVLQQEPLFIYGQIDSLKHIFLNIITNAIQAMPEGGTLTISGRTSGSFAEATELVFRDTGHGIPEEWHEKMFQPFFTTKQAEAGNGLGLWIVKREIERMNASIRVDRGTGEGASFTVIFPAKINVEMTDNENSQ